MYSKFAHNKIRKRATLYVRLII